MSNPVLRDVELQPNEWTPNRRFVRRSFGAMVGYAIGRLVTVAVALAIFIGVMSLGIYAKSLSSQFIYGEPSQSHPVLKPGESTVINGVTIKRIN